MAHSWVQMFDSEYDAFRTYCESYPANAVLLVDTYNTLKSGIPNAIRAFNDVLKPMGITKCGIRLDSGDMSYLTKEARRMLDEAGWESCKITCSNSLDEYIIQDLLLQGACIDSFGVGERLITAKSEPVFGGVYKLVAVERESGEIVPKIKVSENVSKITIPPTSRSFTASTTARTARRLRTISACMTRRRTIRSRSRSSTRKTHGSAKRSRTSAPKT